MAESIRDGLTIIEYGTVTFVNQRLAEITGYSQRELMQMTGIDLAAEDERERLRAVLVEIHEKGVPLHELSFWITAKNGERRFVSNRYSMYANNPAAAT
jgi:PAS domain S-box-containing protein